MSSVRIVFPKLKLADQLRAPGGATVVEALAQSAENLATLSPDCLKELRALSEKIDAGFEQVLKAVTPTSATEFYGLAASGVGLGTVGGIPAVDQTLISLCRLMDYFEMHGRWDQEALRVHHDVVLLFAEHAPRLAEGAPPRAVESRASQGPQRDRDRPPHRRVQRHERRIRGLDRPVDARFGKVRVSRWLAKKRETKPEQNGEADVKKTGTDDWSEF